MSEETKEVKTEKTEKKSTWFNRIWSAVVGAAVAVGAMFGITNEQIATEKAKVETIKTHAVAALEALKSGDVTTATANLQSAVATGKEVVADAKVIAEKVKNADKESVIETAKDKITEAAVKDQVKKVEDATAAYNAENKVAEEVKKAEEKAKKTSKKKTQKTETVAQESTEEAKKTE
ncbi:MAG: hypothetical protein IKP65_04750 [Alphaproteobacteria bacterium]|nr:hypothetical protein [Alphaproteobacteria bacterium]